MKKTICFLYVLVSAYACYAQQVTLTGTVTNKKDQAPLPGVSVQSRSATVATDSKGAFSIPTFTGDRLRFTHSGMLPGLYIVQAGTRSINIQMTERGDTLQTVVVTGYQTEKKADLTGAVSVVKMSDIKDNPLGNPLRSLQGRLPGVMITTDGAPMGEATVRIRGTGTLGNNDPLYVIDGIPTRQSLTTLNPDDIESIQVLKDASSATIYGSRAANGVIVITTRKAKKGYSKIDFNTSISLQSYQKKPRILNTQQRGEMYWQAAVNDRFDPNNNQIYQYDWNNDFDNPVLNRVILPEFIDPEKTMRPANTNWFDEISQTSLIQSHNVSLSHGSEKGSSLFSLSYYSNKGIIKESFQNRITARFNSEYQFFKGRLKIGENFSAAFIKSSTLPTGDIMFFATVLQPIVPIHTIDGGWGGPAPGMTDRHNPVRLIEDTKQNKNYTFVPFGNAYAEVEIIPGLRFRSSFGVDATVSYFRGLRKSYRSGFLSDPSNQVNTNQDNAYTTTFQYTLNYTKTLNKHAVNVLLGEEEVNNGFQNFSGSRQGLALETLDYAYLDAGSTNVNNGGSGGGYSLVSFFGKAQYAFDNKYLASFTIRRDGSSRFGKNNRYGMFPAFSVGWRISQETFVRENLPFISDLKVRYGWGRAGNQEISNTAVYGIYRAIYGGDRFGNDGGTAYDIAGTGTGQLPSGFVAQQAANENLKWESSTQSNIGIDFGFLDNRLTGSADYFVKKATDILVLPPPIAVLGEGGSFYQNGASMDNKGFELLLTYSNNTRKSLSYTISGNVSTYKNKVVYLPSSVLTAYAGNGTDKTILGRSIGSYFGYVADGIFKTQKEVDDHAAQIGKGTGRIRFKDLNNDGAINDLDRDFIGKSDPSFTYGINFTMKWRDLDFACFFQGVSGGKVNHAYKIYSDFSSLWVGTNWGARTMQAWSPTNSDSEIPALTLLDANQEARFSTYYLEPATYLKLRTLQVGYALSNLSKTVAARVFLEGTNLLTIKSKKFSGVDPESLNSGYPIPSVYTLGLNISF
jgi:TonB-linked SusC/RagA family outer membrane protein